MLSYTFSTSCSCPNYAIPAFQQHMSVLFDKESFDFALIFNTHQVCDGISIDKYLKYHFGTEKPYVFFQIPYFATQKTFRKDGFGAVFFKFENPNSKVGIEIFPLRDIKRILEYAEWVRKLNKKVFHIVILNKIEILIEYLNPVLEEASFKLNYPFFGWVSGTNDWNDGSFIITNKGILKNDELLLIRFENFEVYTKFFYNIRKLTTTFLFRSNGILKIKEIEGENPHQLLTHFMETLREDKNNIKHFPFLITSHEPKDYYVRYPKRLEDDGLVMWGDVPKEGEFIFINQYEVSGQIEKLLKEDLNINLPDWDFLIAANCVGKGLFIDPKTEYEALKNSTRKPYIFLGTLGEITCVNRKPFLLNGSLNVLAIKEVLK